MNAALPQEIFLFVLDLISLRQMPQQGCVTVWDGEGEGRECKRLTNLLLLL